MIFPFKRMNFIDCDEHFVLIWCGPVAVELSILQLAKLWQTDKKVLKLMDEQGGFGSVKLEDQCKETRKLVNEFPKIKVTGESIVMNETVMRHDEDVFHNPRLKVIGEDLVGWEREGIAASLPNRDLEGKKLKMTLRPNELVIEER